MNANLYSIGKNGRINRQVKHDGANFFTGLSFVMKHLIVKRSTN
jgi:hypothetical protein